MTNFWPEVRQSQSLDFSPTKSLLCSMNPQDWINLFREYYPNINTREWMNHFGLSAELVNLIWDYLVPAHFLPVHLLWALYFLRCYHNIDHAHVFWRVSVNTYITRVFEVIRALHLYLPSLPDPEIRFQNEPLHGPAYMAIDTKLCPIWVNRQDYRTQARFYSAHHHAHGYKYEFVVDLNTGYLLWFSGPYYGSEADISIARGSGVLELLLTGEKFYGDKGYAGELARILTPFRYNPNLLGSQVLWNRHMGRKRVIVENSIGRFSKFQCTQLPWRHATAKHHICMEVVARLASLDLIRNPVRKDVLEHND
jgi:hypothetical protein